jgi:hypothetical protein
MNQQISVDDAFPVYQRRCGELFNETLLLRAQVEVLERQISSLEAERSRLMKELEVFGVQPQPNAPVTSEC